VGVNSHVEIGVSTEPGCMIGSLSMVPKFSHLGPGVYVGAPVHRLTQQDTSAGGAT